MSSVADVGVTYHLDLATLADKINGCWQGKNCGGTLGTPLEKIFGEEELFDVWWYPKLEPGGIPNDDLEMQLVWLKALEEVGLNLTAQDLAQYWLNHIGYNWDEYGLSKANLKLGLRPPVSGNYNNSFRDCMGCPIRSEIWSCIAPGMPRLACRYAFEDAICDHAGGESVYGELFNAAVGSAAFVVSDLKDLVAIGRTYVPDHSRTAKAIDAALEAHRQGWDWKTARNMVREAAPHYNAQYSPINLGFQVVGLLYGNDFGDALCKTVNCGYDTDCTGATVGSLLGTIQGANALPAKWVEPLGDAIATNESWGGLRSVSDGPNPIPKTLGELTHRVIKVARAVLAREGMSMDFGFEVSRDSLFADDSIRAMWTANPNLISQSYPGVTVGIDYTGDPVAIPDQAKTVRLILTNTGTAAAIANVILEAPAGWSLDPPETHLHLSAGGSASADICIHVPGAGQVLPRNDLACHVSIEGRPACPGIAFPLIGARKIGFAGPYRSGAVDFDTPFAPENDPTSVEWRTLYCEDDSLPFRSLFPGSCVVYARLHLYATRAEKLAMWAPVTCMSKVWVDGQARVSHADYAPVRPSLECGDPRRIDLDFKPGFHEVLIKLVQGPDAPPFEGYIRLSNPGDLFAGNTTIVRTWTPEDR